MRIFAFGEHGIGFDGGNKEHSKETQVNTQSAECAKKQSNNRICSESIM